MFPFISTSFKTQQQMQVGTETNGTLNMKWIKTTINLLSFNPTKVRHTQTICRQIANKLFDRLGLFCGACVLNVNMTSVWKLNF